MAEALLHNLIQSGISVEARGERLRLVPKDRVTPELREQIKASKASLLALLREKEAGDWFSNNTNRVVLGDCLAVMKQIPDDSVDLIATDPPYGIKFMGKDWDKALPNPETWKECLRVLKPGGFAFIMSSPGRMC